MRQLSWREKEEKKKIQFARSTEASLWRETATTKSYPWNQPHLTQTAWQHWPQNMGPQWFPGPSPTLKPMGRRRSGLVFSILKEPILMAVSCGSSSEILANQFKDASPFYGRPVAGWHLYLWSSPCISVWFLLQETETDPSPTAADTTIRTTATVLAVDGCPSAGEPTSNHLSAWQIYSLSLLERTVHACWNERFYQKVSLP